MKYILLNHSYNFLIMFEIHALDKSHKFDENAFDSQRYTFGLYRTCMQCGTQTSAFIFL